jgi:hypothetical protein
LCAAPADIAAAQLLQQNVWPARDTIVLSSTIGISQWAHRDRVGSSSALPEAMATQFPQQYVLPCDSRIVLWSLIAVPQWAQVV